METNDKYIGKMLDERYEILEIIGEGGMAVVYRALDRRLNRYVAVKIMRDDMASDEEFRRRFCTESHAVAMLSHPNIVAVYDVSHNDNVEYIVMELVDGITLKQYMERKGVVAWKEVVHFTKQISKALAHAHERGIIHRDIKPQNIMLLRDGTIKVGDFGIAALENEVYENNGEAIGSIHYIAPEQARGECPDARSDIYSLGVVMYEMLTGELPFNGNTLGEIAVQHMNAKPVPPRDKNPAVPTELERITLKAMNADLNARYQSANALLGDLEAFIHTPVNVQGEIEEDYENPDVKPVRSSTELSKDRYRMRRRRSGVVSFMSGTFGLLVLAIGLFVFLWNFWLRDVFSPAERIPLPNFVGSNYDAVIGNTELSSTYKFNVIYVSDDSSAPGTIINQDPAAGRSMMVTPSGIEVDITVNAGSSQIVVPNVTNTDYREAMRNLRAAGFNVEIENAASDSYTKDYVIASIPAPGDSASAGDTVTITVSAGPEILYVSMPNLVGSTEDSAISKIESSNLSYGGSDRVVSDYEPGTVIDQSISASESIAEHTKIYLTVSAGPQG